MNSIVFIGGRKRAGVAGSNQTGACLIINFISLPPVFVWSSLA